MADFAFMKVYKITEDRYIVTDGTNVWEANEATASAIDKGKATKIKRFILIAEKYYKSVQELSQHGIDTDYADPEKLEYIIDQEVIKVDDKEYSFSVSKHDAGSTVVFIKSGYSKPELAFLYEELVKLGVLVINSPEAVKNTSNKWITYQLLEKHNIMQPVSVLVSSHDISKKDHSMMEKKLKSIYRNPSDDDKYVCKILHGHGGRGVFVCRHKNILSILQAIFAINADELVLVQKKIDIKDGDMRFNILTIGGKQQLINAVRRTGSSSDFRTNLSLGGHAEEFEPEARVKKLAFEVAKISGLTWAGVDIIEDQDGNLFVIEVNGAPGTPYDVDDQEELLRKNTEFYNRLTKMIGDMI